MHKKLLLAVIFTSLGMAVSGCVPLAVGAAGAVVADKVVEDQNGGDGLF